jgi:capsular polysaccharide biosynthesis protein
VAERRRELAIVAAGAVLGLGAGLVLTLLTPKVYRATTVLQLSTAADPRLPGQTREPAEVLAGSYAELLRSRPFLAGLAPRVAGGRFDADELDARVDATHEDGSAVIEVTAEAPSRREAQQIAAGVAGSLVALVRQLARQRAEQLRGELTRLMRRAPNAAARRALGARLARTAATRVEQAGSVRVAAAAYAPADPVRPDALQNLAGGLLLGLVAGLATTLLRRERDVTPPRVVLEGPQARTVVTGRAAFRLRAWDEESGVAAVELLVSNGDAGWRAVARLEAAAGDAEWDTTTVADGEWWVTAVAHDRAGLRAATDPLPLVVRNDPTAGVPSPA